MSRYQPITPARLDWQSDTPASRDFDDIYFNSDGGLAESRYVFLQANDLPQRWQGKKRFTIAETGFGSGLNFLATLALWQTSAADDATLHFISAEKHPLSRTDLDRALTAWPQLKPLADELINIYPPPLHGYHRGSLLGGRVTLTLLFGDACEMYGDLHSGIDAGVDAWFLDGFAPAKNPAMWTAELFTQIARLSHDTTTFSTFTAAGVVRRGLQAAGFEIEKLPGFGRKREMIRGTFRGQKHPSSPLPWFELSNIAPPVAKTAVVIGAGLAGCSSAWALAKRGWHVTLIERHTRIAAEASGNHSGVVLPRLTADMSAEGRFYLSASLHTSQQLDSLKAHWPDLGWQRSGVVQQMSDHALDKLAALQLPEEIFTRLDRHAASAQAGTPLNNAAAFYPLAGWLDPAQLCQHLLQQGGDGISLITEQTAISLSRHASGWQISNRERVIASAEVVVLANGVDARRFAPDAFPLQKVRGQLAYLQAKSPDRESLKTPVCFDGYVIPAYQNQHTAGATYDPRDNATEIESGDQEAITAALRAALPHFEWGGVSGGRVAFRTASPDHLPLVGPVADEAFYRRHYIDLKHGRPARQFDNARYHPGLFVSSGHGSRGLTSCLLSAELIAAMNNHEPLPLPRDLVNALHPARFIVRQLRRGR